MMSVYLRLLQEKDKAAALSQVAARVRGGEGDTRMFDVAPDAFDPVPGKPFAYWVSDAVRQTFQRLPAFEGEGRTVKQGLATADDFRFVRGWWEVGGDAAGRWFPFAKGGAYSPFYADIYLVVNWAGGGKELDAFAGSVIRNPDFYFRPGLTWPLRARRFAPQALPVSCIFSVRGYCAFPNAGDELETLAVFNSTAFDFLFKTALGRYGYPEFIVGILQILPWAAASDLLRQRLASLTRAAWSSKRTLDTVEETSHAFLVPAALSSRLGYQLVGVLDSILTQVQEEIDDIAFDLYGFSPADRQAALAGQGDGAGSHAVEQDDAPADDESDDDAAGPVDDAAGLLSWAVGVAFGRFDWRLATGERALPPEPDPFDPLPARSPGMLPEGAQAFHAHAGVLVDDHGHPHDLPRLVEDVLARVGVAAPQDVRRWLRREFFAFHLQRYSRSRRKAPIYWPLATASGEYTLWIYQPALTGQTLFTAINDLVEPKLHHVRADLATLRLQAQGRSREEERRFEVLQALELELLELRDTLQRIAPTYKPHADDGIQISAAPLWPLFRHKPWQKLLKDTWAKLESGDYDWAHLAMNYWPDRVREKCKTDKSLAIAHRLEHLYVEPEAQPRKARGPKKAEGLSA
jgi:hypothetical protein